MTAYDASDANPNAATSARNGRLRAVSVGAVAISVSGAEATGGHGLRSPKTCAGTVTTASTTVRTR